MVIASLRQVEVDGKPLNSGPERKDVSCSGARISGDRHADCADAIDHRGGDTSDQQIPVPETSQWPASVRHTVRSEEHTSELQSLMRISYAVFCLKKTQTNNDKNKNHHTTS